MNILSMFLLHWMNILTLSSRSATLLKEDPRVLQLWWCWCVVNACWCVVGACWCRRCLLVSRHTFGCDVLHRCCCSWRNITGCWTVWLLMLGSFCILDAELLCHSLLSVNKYCFILTLMNGAINYLLIDVLARVFTFAAPGVCCGTFVWQFRLKTLGINWWRTSCWTSPSSLGEMSIVRVLQISCMHLFRRSSCLFCCVLWLVLFCELICYCSWIQLIYYCWCLVVFELIIYI